jgi:F-type H+-transporting ATPase subunit a
MTGSAPEHELWFTALLNQYLAAPAAFILERGGPLVGYHADAGTLHQPWTNAYAMEALVLALLVVVAALLRPRFSIDRPGKFQQLFEVVYEFIRDQAADVIGHGSKRYVAMFATIFILILVSNLLGVVPSFESPTMFIYVPAGIALVSFSFYNLHGVREMGLLGHLKHFAGPLWWLAWFMFPLEIISHCIRPVSLTIRLFANMLAGEQVTLGFLAIVPLLVPVLLMGLHVFVSFLQAFIFTVLSMVYVGGVVTHEEH